MSNKELSTGKKLLAVFIAMAIPAVITLLIMLKWGQTMRRKNTKIMDREVEEKLFHECRNGRMTDLIDGVLLFLVIFMLVVLTCLYSDQLRNLMVKGW